MSTWMMFFHIFFVLVLAGGVLASPIIRAQIKRSTHLHEVHFGMKLLNRLHTIYTLPSLILAGIWGFGLVSVHDWGFGKMWVRLSILIYLSILALNVLYLSPQLKKRLKASEESMTQGHPTDLFQALQADKKFGMFSDLNAMALVILTLLMTFKTPE